jgi:hypothetical protein
MVGADEAPNLPEILGDLGERPMGDQQQPRPLLGGVPASSADGHEKILASVCFSVTDCGAPLIKVSAYDRRCVIPTERRGKSQVDRHCNEVKIEIPARPCGQWRPESKCDVSSMLQLVERATCEP